MTYTPSRQKKTGHTDQLPQDCKFCYRPSTQKQYESIIMSKSFIQQCTRFNKINHPHYFVEAVRKKDYIGICRHFLWQINRQNNQPLTRKSIVSTIAGLTEYGDIDSRSLTNALVILAKSGEIERYKNVTNRIGFNPEVTNQVRWSRFNSVYNGNQIRVYTEDEANAITKLLKLSNSIPFMPKDFEDLEHTTEIEENNMLKYELGTATKKIEELSQVQNDMKKMLTEVLTELRKHDPEKVEQIKERHLKLVKD